MRSYPTIRRVLLTIATLSIFGAVVVGNLWLQGPSSADHKAAQQTKENNNSWTMFGGTVHRNMVNTVEKNMPTEWSIEPGREKNIKWSVQLGSKAYGGPVISGGKIFIGTNNGYPRDKRHVDKDGKPIDKGIIMCFRESDGKFLWQAVHDKLPAGQVNDWPKEGICSTPVVEGDRLYYVSNRCEVVCADTETGKSIWTLDMIGKLGVFPHNLATCSPLIVGDMLFVVTSNGVDEGHINVPKPEAPSFLALDKKTGKVIWQDNSPSIQLVKAQQTRDRKSLFKELVDRGQLLMHGQWSNPAYAEVNGKAQVIFPGGDGWLYSFEPKTGKLIWKFDCNPKDAKYVLGGKGTRNDFIATPVVYDNKVYIGVGQDPEHVLGVGHLWCIDMTKEGDVSPEIVTDYDTDPPRTRPNPNSAMVWHYGGAAPPGSERNFVFGRTLSTCAIHEDILYVAEQEGILHCLDAKTGKKYWEHELDSAQTWSSPSWIDGKIYMGNDNGEVFIFAHGKEKKLINQINMKTEVRATPVAANGVLYIMNQRNLYAIRK